MEVQGTGYVHLGIKLKDMEKLRKRSIDVFESNILKLESLLERMEEAARVDLKRKQRKEEKAYEDTACLCERGYYYDYMFFMF